jgi:hypothetical protein
MLEILQFAAASWWNLGVTLTLILATAIPLHYMGGLIRVNHIHGGR